MIFRRAGTQGIPELARPLLGLGVISVTMLCFIQLLCNVIRRRSGWISSVRVVAVPSARHTLGKEPGGRSVGVRRVLAWRCVVLQVLQPMRSLHFLATLVQMLISFVLCCLMGNVVSILAPSAISVGSLKPAKAKISTMLIHIVVAMLSPLVLLPGFSWSGRRTAPRSLDWTVLGCRGGDTPVPGDIGIRVRPGRSGSTGVAWMPKAAWLQSREQAILEMVTQRAE